MTYEQTHEAFIQHHLSKRTGERRGRLERGHRDAEKLFCRNVWLPLMGNFDDLHPEYEVADWRGMPYYCDFVWLTLAVKLVIEIKGFIPHVRDMDRQRYCNELNRETFLKSIGFEVVSFAFDDVKERPELIIALLRALLGRYRAPAGPAWAATVIEREVIRLACRLGGTLRPIDVEMHLGINHRTAVQTLQSLCAKACFEAASGQGGKHIVRYALRPHAVQTLQG